jgi:hypothetical protein
LFEGSNRESLSTVIEEAAFMKLEEQQLFLSHPSLGLIVLQTLILRIIGSTAGELMAYHLTPDFYQLTNSCKQI